MIQKKLTRDFTSGSIAKSLLVFMLPFMLSNALQVLYSTIDMLIVGTYVGTPGLSAVSQSSQIVNFGVMICMGFSNGGQILISQALGSGKESQMNRIIGTLFSLLMIMAGVITVVLLLGSKWILQLVNIPAESERYAMEYLIICSAGLVFTAGYNMVSAVLRGMGDSQRPFLFIAIASGVNLVLDILFTGVLGWEVAGAAWATIIGQAVSFAFSVVYLYRHKRAFGFDFQRKNFAPDRHYSRMIAQLGAPMAIQSASIHIAMIAVNAMVNNVSLVASATFGVGMRIDDIVNKLSLSIQNAATPIISQNIAARKPERAIKTVHWTWVYSTAMTVVFMLAYVFLGKLLFMAFSDDPLVHDLSGTFIRGILWMFPAFAVMRGSNAFIQGIGNSRLSMVLGILEGVVLRIGLSWLFGTVLNWGFYGMVLGYALAPYGMAIPGLIYFLSGIWKKRKVLAEDL